MRNHLWRASLAVVAGLLFQGAAQGQATSLAERGNLLAKYGKVVWRPAGVALPIGTGVGKVCCDQPVKQDGALSIRLHFKVEAAPPAATWAIRVLDGAGKSAWTYSPATVGGAAEFWSDEVAGDTATVEVYSTQENNPLRIFIDRVGVTDGPPAGPRSITGDNGLTPITDATVPADIRRLGQSVARMRFVGDDGEMYVCTGFLISSDLFITNQHCPQSDSEWRSTMVDFDFDAAASAPRTTRFKEFLLASPALDFAIYRLTEKQTGRQPLKLAPAAASNNQALVIIQHPQGQPKQVSLLNCRVSAPSVQGVTTDPTDFAHLCDTMGGSSGSGAIDLASHSVVGLHHLGFRPADALQANRAVLMKRIIDFIKTNRPDIQAEVGLP